MFKLLHRETVKEIKRKRGTFFSVKNTVQERCHRLPANRAGIFYDLTLMLFNASGFLHGCLDLFDRAGQDFSGTVNFMMSCKFPDADSECAFNNTVG